MATVSLRHEAPILPLVKEGPQRLLNPIERRLQAVMGNVRLRLLGQILDSSKRCDNGVRSLRMQWHVEHATLVELFDVSADLLLIVRLRPVL